MTPFSFLPPPAATSWRRTCVYNSANCILHYTPMIVSVGPHQVAMDVRRRSKTAIYFSRGNWVKEPKTSRKPEVSTLIPINGFNSCNDSLFARKTLTLHRIHIHPLFWCSTVMSLQFTHVRPFTCWDRLRNLRRDCSAVFIA